MIETQRFPMLLIALPLLGAILAGCKSTPGEGHPHEDDPFAPPPYGEVKGLERDSSPPHALRMKIHIWGLDDLPFVPWNDDQTACSMILVMDKDGGLRFPLDFVSSEIGQQILKEIEETREAAIKQHPYEATTDSMLIIADTTADGIQVEPGDLVNFVLYVSGDDDPVTSRGGHVAVE